MFVRLSWFIILVNRSLGLMWPGIWEIRMRFVSNCSLMKWYLVLMCLVLYDNAVLFAMVIADELSDLSVVGGNTKLSCHTCWWHISQNKQRVHDISFAHCASATYSDSADDSFTRVWRFDFHEIGTPLILNSYPVVDLLVSVQPAQLASAVAVNDFGASGPEFF